jgi:uncharacterized OB-fold protein
MSTDVASVEVDGRGVIHSFTEVRLGMSEAFHDKAPYNIALVDTETGLRVLTNIVGQGSDSLIIGQAVEPLYQEDEAGRVVLVYRRREAE